MLFGCNQNVDETIPKNDKNIDVESFFDFNSLSSEAKNELSEDYWLGTCKINKIDFTNGGIILDIGDENLSKIMVVTNKKVVLSYSIGSNSSTIIYDKKTSKLLRIESSMFITGLSDKNVLTVSKDYYDSLDVDDPNYQGHIFETGTYDMSTDKYTKQQNDNH